MDNTQTTTTSKNINTKPVTFSDNINNTVSTPHAHVSSFFYSAPTSPTHHPIVSSTPLSPLEPAGGSFEFELSSHHAPPESMTSADELFFNGQILPTQNLERRRKARSLSDNNTGFDQWLHESVEMNESLKTHEEKHVGNEVVENETETASSGASGASSRSSSVGRNSKRWVFLKEFLYRSKSEGRNNNNSSSSNNNSNSNNNDSSSNNKSNYKRWAALSLTSFSGSKKSVETVIAKTAVKGGSVKWNRRGGRSASAHEVHYTRNRAEAEEMKRKTLLPYKEGLFGCLGFSSKSYGAVNGFARALNTVSSR